MKKKEYIKMKQEYKYKQKINDRKKGWYERDRIYEMRI